MSGESPSARRRPRSAGSLVAAVGRLAVVAMALAILAAGCLGAPDGEPSVVTPAAVRAIPATSATATVRPATPQPAPTDELRPPRSPQPAPTNEPPPPRSPQPPSSPTPSRPVGGPCAVLRDVQGLSQPIITALRPTEVRPGDVVHVEASRFTPESEVLVHLGPVGDGVPKTLVAQALVSDVGTVTADFVMPALPRESLMAGPPPRPTALRCTAIELAEHTQMRLSERRSLDFLTIVP